MVLDAALLNNQHYKVRIKGKVEQFREWSSTLPNTSVEKILKRSISVANFTLYIYIERERERERENKI